MNLEMVSKGMGIAELREAVQGSVYVPGEADYDAARQAWNLIVVQEPRVIVDAETPGDVQAAVAFARASGLPIGVMATGHGTPRGCDGVLIRMARMMEVRIDPETRLARFQGGALVRDVLAAAAPHGLAMLSGSSPHVGVVGYTLGGGYGLMLRKHGLAMDRVREARIVTPGGALVTASARENPDLFWAIQGGGGAFGVVVELTIELVAQPTVYGGATFYPAEDAASVLRAFAAWCRDLPEEVSPTALLMNLPPLPTVPEPLRGRAVVAINACVCGDLKDAEAWIAPMRRLGTPILDLWGEMPYEASDRIFNDPTDPMPATIQGALADGDLDVDAFLAAVGPIHAMPQVIVQIRAIDGAMGRVDHTETPLGAHRDVRWLVYTVGVPNPFASVAAIHDHASGLFTALGGSLRCRGPLNFIGEGDVCAEKVRGVYGEAQHARLCRVKAAIDPANAFRFAGVGIVD